MERFTDICTQVENDLALFVGGELEAPTEAALQRHLEACASCTVKARAARAAHDALHGGLTAAGGADGASARASEGIDLWPSIRAKLDREGRLGRPAPAVVPAVQASPGNAIPGVARRSARFHLRYAAAAAILLAALGWWTFGRDSGASSGRPTIVDATPVPGDRAPAAPVSNGAQPDAFSSVQLAPGDALARGLQPVPVNAPSLTDRAGNFEAEAELRSPIFYGPRSLQGSPAGARFVPPRR